MAFDNFLPNSDPSDTSLPIGDPYPWVTTDENGAEFRTHTAHEDGFDAKGNEWSGWTYSPRSSEELRALGF